mmetsp:Transcript_46254/g.112945  ORF Transcript_46254/g.112945 Transcript_46254/m.112945 type:complete len:154 (-) Transcript_46254:563-1024(-)
MHPCFVLLLSFFVPYLVVGIVVVIVLVEEEMSDELTTSAMSLVSLDLQGLSSLRRSTIAVSRKIGTCVKEKASSVGDVDDSKGLKPTVRLPRGGCAQSCPVILRGMVHGPLNDLVNANSFTNSVHHILTGTLLATVSTKYGVVLATRDCPRRR